MSTGYGAGWDWATVRRHAQGTRQERRPIHYRLSLPGGPCLASQTGSIRLAFEPPLDWATLLGYIRARAIPGVEAVTDGAGGRYWRTVAVDGRAGWLSVRCRSPAASSDRAALTVEYSASLRPVRPVLGAALRRQFDLDLPLEEVTATLDRDPLLRRLRGRRPGLRLPGTVNRFELALRAVLGQQVTVRGASTLAGRLVGVIARPLPGSTPSHAGGSIRLTHLPVEPERLADASPASLRAIGLPESRVRSVIALARATASGLLPELAGSAACSDPAEFERRITQLPGIGPWTAQYILMRGLKWPDAFPAGDLGLRKAMGGISESQLAARARRWSPWRAYAAQHLWASLKT